MNDVEILRRALERERHARKEAENLLECKSRDLYHSNCRLASLAGELNEQVQKTQTIMDSAMEGMVVFSHTGKIESFNPASERIFGVPASEAIGNHICRFVPSAEGCDQASCRIDEARFSVVSSEGSGEYYGVHSNGFAIPLEVCFSAVSHGDERFYLAIIRDISRRKQLESQLSQSQKLEAVGQLAAGIAHEINTPIQYVGDNTRFLKSSFRSLDELIEKNKELVHAPNVETAQSVIASISDLMTTMDLEFLREEIPLAIEQALEGAETVTKIVRAMKEFSHPGNSEKQWIDLNRAIESTLTVSRNEWKYTCELQCHLDPEVPKIPCYPSELNQALLNLIINAAHAIDSRGTHREDEDRVLRIRTYTEGSWAVIEIGDTGCGIPTKIQNRIFDPFFTTKPVGKGTGQGLAIAYNVIVKKHQGQIEFDSEEGVGTTFHLRLPLHSMDVSVVRDQAEVA